MKTESESDQSPTKSAREANDNRKPEKVHSSDVFLLNYGLYTSMVMQRKFRAILAPPSVTTVQTGLYFSELFSKKPKEENTSEEKIPSQAPVQEKNTTEKENPPSDSNASHFFGKNSQEEEVYKAFEQTFGCSIM